jgi:Tol biopolymer transport system component
MGREDPPPPEVGDSHPAWSPDGSRVAFVHLDPEGKERIGIYSLVSQQVQYIGEAWDMDWSPAGDRMVTLWQWDLSIYDCTTGVETQLTDTGVASAPNWSPVGETILYRAVQFGGNGHLWTISAQGSDVVDVGVTAGTADWSPDGTRIVYTSADEREIRVLDLVDSRVMDTLILDVRPFRARTPRWSPDGSTLLFHRFGSSEVAPPGLWICDADGRNARALIEWARAASWHPDGTRVVYEQLTVATWRYELWVLDLQTGQKAPLFPEGGGQ